MARLPAGNKWLWFFFFLFLADLARCVSWFSVVSFVWDILLRSFHSPVNFVAPSVRHVRAEGSSDLSPEC